MNTSTNTGKKQQKSDDGDIMQINKTLVTVLVDEDANYSISTDDLFTEEIKERLLEHIDNLLQTPYTNKKIVKATLIIEQKV